MYRQANEQVNCQQYKQILQQARVDLANAIQQRDHWNLEIMRLQQVVNAFAVAANDAERQEQEYAEWQNYVELTQAIEALVNSSQAPLSPLQVRDGLMMYGYNIGHYANPMAMIHQTLKRLAENRRIRVFAGGLYTRGFMLEPPPNT